MSTLPPNAPSPRSPAGAGEREPYTLWSVEMPFRKNGTPVVAMREAFSAYLVTIGAA